MKALESTFLAGIILWGAPSIWAQDPAYVNRLAPFVSSPEHVVDRMLELASVKPGETVYDLGAGDGRVVIAAAEKYKANAIGVEISPRLVAEASARIEKLGLAEHDEAALHGFVLTREAAEDVFRTLATERLADRVLNPGLPRDRADIIVAGCCILVGFMRRLQLDEITVSTGSLRDGIALRGKLSP